MKQRTVYCLVALAALSLSPLAHSSADPRADNTRGARVAQTQPVKSADAPQPGVGLTKVGPGTLVLNYVVKRDDGETKVELVAERGAVKKVTATDAGGTRTLKPAKAGARLAQAQPCGAAGQTEKSLTLEDGQAVKVKACNAGLVALLLPAVQKIREAARLKPADGNNRVAAAASCTEDKPCCFEDEKLGMSVCWHP